MYTMQENTKTLSLLRHAYWYFRSHPFSINHICNFDVYFQIAVLPVERHIVFLRIFKDNAKVTR
jgi:hypothetical protein